MSTDFEITLDENFDQFLQQLLTNAPETSPFLSNSLSQDVSEAFGNGLKDTNTFVEAAPTLLTYEDRVFALGTPEQVLSPSSTSSSGLASPPPAAALPLEGASAQSRGVKRHLSDTDNASSQSASSPSLSLPEVDPSGNGDDSGSGSSPEEGDSSQKKGPGASKGKKGPKQPLTPAEKKARRLQKNRESAQLFRQKKKVYVEELEKQVKALTEQQAGLSSQVMQLCSDNTRLKNEVSFLQSFIHTTTSNMASAVTANAAAAVSALPSFIPNMFSFSRPSTAPSSSSSSTSTTTSSSLDTPLAMFAPVSLPTNGVQPRRNVSPPSKNSAGRTGFFLVVLLSVGIMFNYGDVPSHTRSSGPMFPFEAPTGPAFDIPSAGAAAGAATGAGAGSLSASALQSSAAARRSRVLLSGDPPLAIAEPQSPSSASDVDVIASVELFHEPIHRPRDYATYGSWAVLRDQSTSVDRTPPATLDVDVIASVKLLQQQEPLHRPRDYATYGTWAVLRDQSTSVDRHIGQSPMQAPSSAVAVISSLDHVSGLETITRTPYFYWSGGNQSAIGGGSYQTTSLAEVKSLAPMVGLVTTASFQTKCAKYVHNGAYGCSGFTNTSSAVEEIKSLTHVVGVVPSSLKAIHASPPKPSSVFVCECMDRPNVTGHNLPNYSCECFVK
mmetsp:Transcript_26116/g.42803  ORF Transcript_26116/g.42803 Transcript_26116/m.42803 type:complete len:667 (-) Transcript_26116:311-2311(-)|eukprot:CAMPEP_0184645076 /NCGR_PEP_ID=MMETSP0308-20130426/1629_1 /TAXON_ID=38269 /ORGANISM="Gloeochaete witrockiana, Strain SAG 46.84" /LENGTH=666 /DNA_ID=CAMNT_0027073885 /DNA_START=188 /DNA_END=2188 /DNA_ORIENTATION=-